MEDEMRRREEGGGEDVVTDGEMEKALYVTLTCDYGTRSIQTRWNHDIVS